MRVDLAFTANAQQIEGTGTMSGCQGGSTQLAALLPISWRKQDLLPARDDQRDLRLQLDFDHAQLRPFLDRVPGVLGFSAVADGQLVVRGMRDRVHYHGDVLLRDGKLYAVATGQEFHDISMNLQGNGTWIKIDGLRARTGEGSLSAEGGLGFELWKPDRLSIAVLLDNFPAQREGVDLAWLTGSAVLTSEIGEYKTLTAVKIHSLSVRLPDSSTRSLQPLDPHPDVVLTTVRRKAHPDIPYVLQFIVDGRRGVSVHRDDFDANVSTELALSYEEPQFRAGGYVTFTRGSFVAFDKRFQLTRGSMLLDGTADLNPEINLVASYQPPGTGNAPVVVTVSGTLTDPHVEFASESCPGDGAVVLLLSGRCPNVDAASTGDAQGAQSAFAASVVGGILTLGTTGGPRISVESTGQNQTRVKAGIEAVPKFMRSFVQRVYLQGAVSSAQQGTGTDTTTSAATSTTTTLDFLIELYFPHNLVGTGRFSPETAWGLDVTWEP
jgi:translocation and assembly module TamB